MNSKVAFLLLWDFPWFFKISGESDVCGVLLKEKNPLNLSWTKTKLKWKNRNLKPFMSAVSAMKACTKWKGDLLSVRMFLLSKHALHFMYYVHRVFTLVRDWIAIVVVILASVEKLLLPRMISINYQIVLTKRQRTCQRIENQKMFFKICPK